MSKCPWGTGELTSPPGTQCVLWAHLPNFGISESLGPIPKAGEITQSYGSHMIKRGLPQKASIAVHGVSMWASVPDPNYCQGQSCCYTVDKRQGHWNLELPRPFQIPWPALTVTGLSLTRDRQVDGKQQGKDMDCPIRPETRAAEAWPFVWDSRSV